MEFDREKLRSDLQALAARGIYIGTSSWKYPGWCNMLYDESRYIWAKKFALKRFERNCLFEYSEVFKTVCVDAAYYTYPTVKYLEGLADQVTPDFLFAFKVTDDITIKRFPNLPRFGALAGQLNPNFLNAERFAEKFLVPCETIRSHVGILMFEFSKFHSSDYEHGRDFIAALDGFLARLPTGWPYGIEMRNKTWLQPEYFQCLSRHGVTHVFNSWTDMPPASEQMGLPGSQTNDGLVAARFLLKPGRKYEEAVKAFQPYTGTKEIYEEARRAGAALIREGKKAAQRRTMLFVNNRLEGNALQTIQAMLEGVEI